MVHANAHAEDGMISVKKKKNSRNCIACPMTKGRIILLIFIHSDQE